MKQYKQLDQLERLRTELIERLAGLDSEVLNRGPEGGGWSVIQVVAHLIQAERLSLEYLRKKTQQPEAIAKSGAFHAVKSRFLGVAMKLPFKISAPARTAEVPDRAELGDLDADWRQVRSGWRSFVDQFPAELHDKAVYRHPVVGPLSLEQALRFLVDHFRRHRGQIERVLGEVDPSKSAA